MVIDRLIGGLAGGGTRMRKGCTLEEVQALARAMSLKFGILRIPAGGAKAGVDCDPRNPGSAEVLGRFFAVMQPLFSGYMETGEDMGTSDALIAGIFQKLGLGPPFAAVLRKRPDPAGTLKAVTTALAITDDGLPLSSTIGGYGVSVAAVTAMTMLGIEPPGARAVVQGFGSMGGATARYLARSGVRVVGVADKHGVIANEAGLDVEKLLAARNRHGEVDRSALGPGDRELPREEWVGLDAELIVPAADANSIVVGNCHEIRAKLVVEAANLPTTEAALRILHAREIAVVPDFVANSATTGFIWWTFLGDVQPERNAVFSKVSHHMNDVVGTVIHRAKAGGTTLRATAIDLAERNLKYLVGRGLEEI